MTISWVFGMSTGTNFNSEEIRISAPKDYRVMYSKLIIL